MGRKSTMKQLPQNIRKQVDDWIVGGNATIEQLWQYMQNQADAAGIEQVPSRSAIGRYVADVTKTAQALRESREMATALMQEMGPGLAEGDQGRTLVQMMRTLVFRFLKPQIDNPEGGLDPKEFMAMTRAIKDMSHSMRLEQDFNVKIREEGKKEAEEAMRAAANEVAKTSGDALSPLAMFEKVMRVYRGEV